MPKSATPIFLSDDDKSYLKSVLQKGTVESRVHRRAKILLLKLDGMADEAIADKLDISRPTVELCLKKYRESGVKTALEDSKGRGRRIEITDDAKAWGINIACQKPSAFGLPAELCYIVHFLFKVRIPFFTIIGDFMGIKHAPKPPTCKPRNQTATNA